MRDQRPGAGESAGKSAIALAVQFSVLAVVCAAAPAWAATLTRGPYLQLLTPDSVTIVWNTDAAASCSLAIRPVGGAETVIVGEAGKVCAIAVDGLAAGTHYSYVPQANSVPLCSEVIFRTDDPKLQDYSFLVFGDSGTGSSHQMMVGDRMLESPAHFILHVGDMSQRDGGASEYDPQFFWPYEDLIGEVVLWPCRGNHDTHINNGAPWREAFYTPGNNPAGSEDYYSFDFGNAHVIVLDSNADTSPGGAQYRFLDEDLGANTAMWNFVVFHHTIYSAGNKHGGNMRIRENLVPLFDEHGVDIVFTGHDHDYERTEALRSNGIVGPGEGTVYVTTGGGGGSLSGVGSNWFTAYSESAFHFVQVSVIGGSLLLEMVREDGAIRDSMRLEKGSPPICGDDLVNQPGERCDGADDALCPGECDLNCMCPPICGDGIVNQAAEECDGTDDNSCVAGCDPECVCEEAPLILDLEPAADTYIEKGTEATWDHGAAEHMDVAKNPRGISYLKFDLDGLTEPVESATLRLYCINASDDGGTVYAVADSSWVEGSGNGIDGGSKGGPGLTWIEVDKNGDGVLDELDGSAYVPDFTQPVVSLGGVSKGQTLRLDVTMAFQEGPGMYTLAISGGSRDGATYSSRERLIAERRPMLHLELDSDRSCTPDGTRCADGDLCTWPDTCQGGDCVAGNPVICAALDQCHDAGTCDPATGRCSNPPSEDGTPCADVSLCTQGDVCVAGVCTGENRVICTALDQCHGTGVCDPATGSCSRPLKPDRTPCNDGNACTQRDMCVAGVCVGADPVICAALDRCHDAGVCDPATGVCAHPAKVHGTPCEDGMLCNGAEACVNGRCEPGMPVDCDDGVGCTEDVCDEATGTCVHTPQDVACDNGIHCDGVESCHAEAGCVTEPADCDDQIPCTVDVCDEKAGGCAHLPDDESCDDGSVCTTDVCSPVRGCEYTESGVCQPIALDLEPVADTYIEKGAEGTWDHGAAGHLDADTRPRGIIYLKFDLGGLAAPVKAATLRLYCMNASDDGGTVYPVADSSWLEGSGNGIDNSSAGGPGLTWIRVDTNEDGVVDERDGSPYVPDFAQPVVSLGGVSKGQTPQVDVTTAVQSGAGMYTLAITNNSSDGVTYWSREHSNPDRRPALHLELGTPGP